MVFCGFSKERFVKKHIEDIYNQLMEGNKSSHGRPVYNIEPQEPLDIEKIADESIANMVFEMDEDGTITESTLEEMEDINTSLQTPTFFALYSRKQADILLKMMSVEEFESESRKILQNLDIFFGNYYDDIGYTALYSDKATHFIQDWNYDAKSGKEFDVCVINCHASPTTLFSGLSISEIRALKKIKCDCLILLGCNAGHDDWRWRNVAYEFSKKVTGVVVASDGTVESEELYRYLQTFKSIMDKYYYMYTDNRKNYGWVVYEYSSSKKSTTWYSTGLKTISMKSILNYLTDCDLVYYY